MFSGVRDYFSKNPLDTLGYFAATASKPDFLGILSSMKPLKAIGAIGDVASLYNMYQTASTPPAHTPEKGFEIINDLSEVQTRPKTPEEVRRDAALYGLVSGVAATILRGPVTGLVIGNAVDNIAQIALDGTTTYNDNYLTREDWDRVEGNSTHSFP